MNKRTEEQEEQERAVKSERLVRATKIIYSPRMNAYYVDVSLKAICGPSFANEEPKCVPISEDELKKAKAEGEKWYRIWHSERRQESEEVPAIEQMYAVWVDFKEGQVYDRPIREAREEKKEPRLIEHIETTFMLVTTKPKSYSQEYLSMVFNAEIKLSKGYQDEIRRVRMPRAEPTKVSPFGNVFDYSEIWLYPRKFWLLKSTYTMRQHGDYHDWGRRYTVYESRGSFPNKEVALEQILQDSLPEQAHTDTELPYEGPKEGDYIRPD